jgi:hypothetical protein
MAHVGLSERQYHVIVDTFSSLDIGKHGFIAATSLEKCCELLNLKNTLSERQDFIRTLGNRQRVQFEEFVAFAIRVIKRQNRGQGDDEDAEEALLVQPKSVGTRRRIVNWVPFILGMTVPWFFLVFIFGINSFRPAFDFPMWTRIISTLSLLGTVLYTIRQRRKRSVTVPYFIGCMCVVSVGGGWLLGNLNFWENMQGFYVVSQMATYISINPSRLHQGMATTTVDAVTGKAITVWQDAMTPRPTEGKRYQDAGKVRFICLSAKDIL